MNQQTLRIEQAAATTDVDEYKFEPIQGYPMLQWRGKRPFRSTRYYPAQLREIHGPEVDGWRNKMFWGDNLQVMSHLLKEYRGKVQLAYIDPPFASNADYRIQIKVGDGRIANDYGSFEEKQYTDIWSNDEYLQFMFERLVLIRELLSENGSIYLHCDHRKSHHLRCLLDEVFGQDNFRNQISREKCNPKNYTSGSFGNVTDTILFYSKSQTPTWTLLYGSFSETEIPVSFPKMDANGRRYKTAPLHASGIRSGETGTSWRGLMPPPGNHWRYIHSTLDKLDSEGRIEWSDSGNPRKIIYADESKGVPVQDIWTGMKDSAGEYPTEKNEKLLDRIVRASSRPGELIFDCFMGSGTTQAVAMKLGRRFVGADINLGAIQYTSRRLLQSARQIEVAPPLPVRRTSVDNDNEEDEQVEASETAEPTVFYTGFEVYNVNHYDVFRNPAQAKELLVEALELEPLGQGHLFDGTRDGRMWKIMPVNRIATSADLNEIITGLDNRTLQRRYQEQPNKPVERITLVCMGHEPDLAAALKQELKPFEVDVQVVDILRDRQDLQFKRDSEAKVVVRDGELVIEAFYPMNLLQKLSQQKEEVTEWRELVDSVMVDWNFDGGVFQPAVVDVPDKNELVVGRYPVPEDAGTIRVRITDVLSESWEETV